MGRGKHLTNKIEGGGEVLTHEETLKILSEMARNGSVSAAVAMARELRLDPGDEDDGELDAELSTWRTISTFSSDIAYSRSPAALRASLSLV
ncbi:MAG: hypothetical protein ACXWFN_05505 [Solirubrobacterales bacterium]